jgi:hypothetical protein
LYIDLGFAVVVHADESFEPIETSQDGFRFMIHSPYKSGITPGNRDFLEGLPLVDVAHQLPPVDPQPTRVALDDHPATVADAICVEIHGDGLTRQRGAKEVRFHSPSKSRTDSSSGFGQFNPNSSSGT